MATTAEAVAILARELDLSETHVAQRARRLRETGLLPASLGRSHPSMTPEHLVSLLLAVLADVPVKDAPAAAERYGEMLLNGIDTDVMPAERRPANRHTARAYLETIVESFVANDASAAANRRLTVEVVSTWPEIRIFDPVDGTSAFSPAGADPKRWQGDAVRRSTTITGRALARCADILR